jgi:uncharacterized protein (DUF2062 family)
MGSVMLVAAVMVSLAVGVLVAYGICYGMFQVFRIHSQAVQRSRALASEQMQATLGNALAER